MRRILFPASLGCLTTLRLIGRTRAQRVDGPLQPRVEQLNPQRGPTTLEVYFRMRSRISKEISEPNKTPGEASQNCGSAVG
jgi:hypothetical protein